MTPSTSTTTTTETAKAKDGATMTAMTLDEQVDILQQSMEREQEEYKTVVIQAIKGVCTRDSPFADLRTMAAALAQDDDALEAQVVSGGKTNLSYKVYLKDSPDTYSSGVAAVFCKICFSHARWNPDRSVRYDLKRTENEFWIMGEFANMMEGGEGGGESQEAPPIATPYHILNLSDDSKLLVTKWAKCDEQWCNQFIEGNVDRRIIPKLARALSTLNLSTNMDKDFNDGIRNAGENMFQLMKDLYKQVRNDLDDIPDDIADKCVLAMREMSVETFNEIAERSHTSWHTRSVPSHTDAHVFNILVEKKPNVQQLESFGPTGDFCLCDWEMSCWSSKGMDPGKVLFFPLICALCHAVQGHKMEAFAILDCMDEFWMEYSTAMAAGGKNEEYLLGSFRDALGWCGLFIYFLFYQLKMFQDVAPLQEVPEDESKQALASCGFVGFKFMEYGFGTSTESDLTLQDLVHRYKTILKDEVESLLTVRPSDRRPRPRRSSVLRETGRRVSDSFLYDKETLDFARRQSAGPPSNKRRSSALDPLLILDIDSLSRDE